MGEICVRVMASEPSFQGALSAYLAAQPSLMIGGEGPTDVTVVANREGRIPPEALVDNASVLVIGPHGAEHMIAAFEAGAMGYLPEGCPFEEVRRGVMSLAEDQAVLPPYMLGSLLRHVVQRRRVALADLELLDRLTHREREVFELLAIGLDREAISERLFISVGTVRTHLQRLFRKLEIHTHAEVVAMAARCGIVVAEGEGSGVI